MDGLSLAPTLGRPGATAGGGGITLTVPAAPTIGTAVAGNTNATVPFTANGNGGSPITGFTATSTPGGFTGSGASSPVVVSGLTNGTAYTFTVHATNAIGNSSESAASNSITPAASGVTPQPGFTVTADTVFADKLGMTITRSSGSFGTHPNYNKTGSLTWNGLPILCFIAKDFESTAIGTNIIGAALTGGIERSQQNGGNAAQWVVVSDAPTNRTRSARRSNIDARTDPLELTLSSNPATIYQTFKMRPSAGASAGKFSRIFGDNGDSWLATGGTDGFYIRGSDDLNYTAYGGYSGNTQFSTSGWNQCESSFDQVNGKLSVSLNGAVQWKQPGGPFVSVHSNNTDPWTAGNINPSGHTMNLVDERDNTGDYIDVTDWFVDLTLARFVLCDSATFSSATRHEFQVPVTWTTTSVRVGINLGEFPTLTGKSLFFLDTSETPTLVAQF